MEPPFIRAWFVRVACLTAGTAAVVAARQDVPPFRANADLVPISTTVTDESGRFVPHLLKENFEIYDNGKKQPIVTFTNEPQPFSVVVMIDRSGSMQDSYGLTEEGATAFVRAFMKGDRGRVGSFGYRILIKPADFTDDGDRLVDVLRFGLQDGGSSPVWQAIDESVAALKDEQRRRVVLVFTDGYNDPGAGQSGIGAPEVARDVRRADVLVYGVGLTATFRAPAAPPGRLGPFKTPAIPGRTVAPPKPPNAEFGRLVEESGGAFVRLTRDDDPELVFERAADELHQQYVLGFAPGVLDGKVHRLEVKVAGWGYHVRARKTYEATAAR